jgi:hypothetical protein
MISPSPTQPPPIMPVSPEPEKNITPSTMGKGKTRSGGVGVVKAILKPPLKLIYYLIQFVKGHKLLSLGALLLLLLSTSLTNYFATGTLPLGITSDPVSYSLRNVDGSAAITKWLYAVRDDDAKTIQQMQSTMPTSISQPPDPTQLTTQFSQTNGRVWKSIDVIGTHIQDDTSEDTFVEVEFAQDASSSTASASIVFHFITVQGQDQLIGVDLVSARQALQ